MKYSQNLHKLAGLLACSFLLHVGSWADNIRITIESTTPNSGLITTPYWLGFHDGTFDLYNMGEPASTPLERVAEDGEFGPLSDWFNDAMPNGRGLVLHGPRNPNGHPLFFPMQGNSTRIHLDPENPAHRYLSFIAMILPSNDGFIANDDPMALPIYDEAGNFIGGTWQVWGQQVLDAGTEINDEVSQNVPVLGQMNPDTGNPENGVVSAHPGFLPNGPILNGFANGDFTQDNYAIARIIVEKLPESHRSLEIEITNLAPEHGTIFTPVWLGLHNGTFDLFDMGSPANEAVERMAEDGKAESLMNWFAGAVPNGWDTFAKGPVNPDGHPPLFFPGHSNRYFVNVDANNPSHEYLSYLAMILPSNDGFYANDDPTAYRIYEGGIFQPTEIWVWGSDILDAGTEVNDEQPENVPVLGQMEDDSGTEEGGVIAPHAGFTPGGNILTQFPWADFTQSGYGIAKIQVWERFNPWTGIPLNANGFRDSPVFGIVDDTHFPWVEHRHHGVLYFPRGGSLKGFWVHNSQGDLGWIFTSEDYYPRIYRQSDETWYRYIVGSADPRQFENLDTGEIISIE